MAYIDYYTYTYLLYSFPTYSNISVNQTIPLHRQVCSKFQGEMAVTEVDDDYENVFNFMNEETGLGKLFPFSWLRLVDYFEVGYNAQSCMIWEDAKTCCG